MYVLFTFSLSHSLNFTWTRSLNFRSINIVCLLYSAYSNIYSGSWMERVLLQWWRRPWCGRSILRRTGGHGDGGGGEHGGDVDVGVDGDVDVDVAIDVDVSDRRLRYHIRMTMILITGCVIMTSMILITGCVIRWWWCWWWMIMMMILITGCVIRLGWRWFW